MSRRVIKQPNGKFACFSSVVDHFIWYDATAEEARAYLRGEYMEEIEARIDEKMRAAIEDWPPYKRGVSGSGRDRWDHDAYTALMVHPDDTELTGILRECGMTDDEIAALRVQIEAERDDAP